MWAGGAAGEHCEPLRSRPSVREPAAAKRAAKEARQRAKEAAEPD